MHLLAKPHTHTYTGQCSMHCDTPAKERSFLIIMNQPAVWAGAKKTRQKHELDMMHIERERENLPHRQRASTKSSKLYQKALIDWNMLHTHLEKKKKRKQLREHERKEKGGGIKKRWEMKVNGDGSLMLFLLPSWDLWVRCCVCVCARAWTYWKGV